MAVLVAAACGSREAPERPARSEAGAREVDASAHRGPRPTDGGGDADAAIVVASDGGAAALGPDAGVGAEPEPEGDAGTTAGDEAADGGARTYPEVQGDPERFPLHSIATSLETRVMPSPRDVGSRIGYLRMGARMRVGPPSRGGGCSGDWHELAGGGFVCTSDGLKVSASALQRPGAPPPPCLDCPLPYPYGFTRFAHTPMLGKLPDLDETRVIDEIIAERERPPRPRVVPPASAVASRDGGTSAPAPDGGDTPALAPPAAAPPPAPSEAPTAAPTKIAAQASAAAETDASEDPPSRAEARRAPSVIAWLERGFFVSINRLIGAKNRRLYFKTIYGRYVPQNRVFRFPGFTPWQGVRLGEGNDQLPVYYVKATRAVIMPPPGSADREPVHVDRLTRLDVVGAEGRSWRLADGGLIEKGWVARIAASPPPADLSPGEKWIEVDLSEQTLVAYEGDRPILATMVSTGKEGFETPPGEFRVRSKHIATTMDGNTATDGAYSIEDVPWTMYFHRSYALHGAFWHRQYGIARSHGCVNLSPSDARFLFFWTEPTLPTGWHGVHARRDRPGTRVVVHR